MAIRCTVVTPEKTALEQDADLVVVPLVDGETGIQSNHAPMIGRLGYGEMRITTGSQTENFFVDGGFVQVGDNQVSVITNRAVLIAELDKSAAEKSLAEATEVKAMTAGEVAAKEKLVSRARAQVRLAK